MSDAVPGDPQIDIDALILVDEMNAIELKMNNLDRDVCRKLAYAAGTLAAKAEYYWKIRAEQGPLRSVPNKEKNK